LLQGGEGTDVILGDSFELPTPSEDKKFEFVDLAGLDTAASYIKTFANLLKPEKPPATGEASVETAFGLKLSGTGNDKIRAGDGNDLIIAGAGDDTDVDAGPGVDLVYGNAGQDKLLGGPGIDMIVGGPDADVIDGGTDTDFNLLIGDSVTVDLGFDLSALLKGEFKEIGWPKINIEFPDSGNDTLLGGNGIDLLIGGKGQDYLFGRQGTNIAFGDVFKRSTGRVGDIFSFALQVLNPLKSATAEVAKQVAHKVYEFFTDSQGSHDIDADQYFGGPGDDYVFGGDGDDLLWGDCKDPIPVAGVYLPVCNVPESGGRDFLVGGYGDDIIHAGPGGTEEDLDFFFGLIKIDEIGYGGPGDDTFYGGPGNDLLVSDEGTDTFYGGAGDDVLVGGPETDYFYGEEGDDLLFGQDGDDFLDGGPDNDQLFAGSGNDNLSGGDGDDILYLGGGADVIEPGTGNDRIDPADFNQDGWIDAIDIDLLSAQVRSPSPDLQFDLTNDQLVNEDDREFLVRQILGTYFGDADLNGLFDTSDFVAVFVAGEYEDSLIGNSGWAEGDWNGDGEFDTNDFVAVFQDGGYEISATVTAARRAPSPSVSSPNIAAAVDHFFLGPARRKRPAFVS